MIVLVRADATSEIGSGHVMRCAALGTRLMTYGAKIHFVCACLPPQLGEWLHNHGFGLTVLTAADFGDWRTDLAATCDVFHRVGSVDLLIVDHYGLSQAWESSIRSHVRRIMVIDDLADRDHDCDLLLDQNLHDNTLARYEKRVSPRTRMFFGPRYAMLRPEFDEPELVRIRDGSVKRLLVFFGGDPNNQTSKVIDAIRVLGSFAPECIVVLGLAHPYRQKILNSVTDLPGVDVLDTTDNMARLIAQADLAIGTCGVSAWERCALGLPTLVVVTAENQREDASILHRLGAVENLGDADTVSVDNWVHALRQTMNNPCRLRAMAKASLEVMAGRKAALAELEKALIDGMH